MRERSSGCRALLAARQSVDRDRAVDLAQQMIVVHMPLQAEAIKQPVRILAMIEATGGFDGD
jgi:hypothetical protein